MNHNWKTQTQLKNHNELLSSYHNNNDEIIHNADGDRLTTRTVTIIATTAKTIARW